jgi:hypothetical protein
MARAAAPSGVARLWKWGAGSLSAAAALVSIISSVQSFNRSAQVHRIRVAPAFDTAFAVGDTLQLAATIIDARGEVLPGVGAGWTSTGASVASVDSAGTVVARRGGVTTIVAAAGGRIAQSQILVRQRPAAIRILGDSALRMDEGAVKRPVARVVDGRGHAVPGETVAWRSDDPSIATVDGAAITVIAAGRTVLTASGSDFSAELPLEVVAVPASITLLGGDGQRAAAGRRLPQPVRAQIVSRSGRPMAGVAVRFGAADPADAVEPGIDTTDAEGVAHAAWTLGGQPGRHRLAIGVEGIGAATLVSAEADPVAENTRMTVLGDSITARAGEALPRPVGVRITDSTGTPLPDLQIAWSTDAGGSIEGEESRTDSLGEAHARWTLGPRSGAQRAYAQAGGSRAVPRFTLRAVALPGPAATAALVGALPLRGVAGQPAGVPLTVRVADRAGNPVPGVGVRLEPATGSVPDSTMLTDSTGRATFAWTLGWTAGAQSLRARVDGVDRPLDLTVQVRAGPARRLTLTTVPAAATAGKALAAPVTALLTDAYGNPVAGEVIVIAVTGGKVAPARAVTDAQGHASTRWTLGSVAGDQRITATAAKATLRASATVRAAKPVKSRRAP